MYPYRDVLSVQQAGEPANRMTACREAGPSHAAASLETSNVMDSSLQGCLLLGAHSVKGCVFRQQMRTMGCISLQLHEDTVAPVHEANSIHVGTIVVPHLRQLQPGRQLQGRQNPSALLCLWTLSCIYFFLPVSLVWQAACPNSAVSCAMPTWRERGLALIHLDRSTSIVGRTSEDCSRACDSLGDSGWR